MPAKVAIVVVNFNGWDDTRRCLRSLAPIDASVILVDNASTDDRCAEFRAEFPDCQVLRNSENGGWAGGNNTGIRIALERGAEWILLLNNDTIVSPRLIESLLAAAGVKAASTSPSLSPASGERAGVRGTSFGIIGPVICWMDEPDKVMTDGCDFNHPNGVGFFQRHEVPLTKRVAEVEIVNGCAMMISAEVLRKIGRIDERFFLVHEESDLCLRARNAGFRCGVLGEALVWHKGSSSFARSGKKLQRYYDARNLYLLLRKHHRHPGGRGRIASLGAYFRYVYHRYCIEREQGNGESARAVVAGLCDALGRHYGPMRQRNRLGARLLSGLMETVRRCRR